MPISPINRIKHIAVISNPEKTFPAVYGIGVYGISIYGVGSTLDGSFRNREKNGGVIYLSTEDSDYLTTEDSDYLILSSGWINRDKN